MASVLPTGATENGLIRKTSTEQEPYHFVGSGLLNVYLVGVKYELDQEVGTQSADIPCLPKLMEAIGKILVEKRTALGADEIRFLRKRLRLPSKDFAMLIGKTSEQYSRIETGSAKLTKTVERVIRLLYATLALFPPNESQEVARTIWTAGMTSGERIVACRDDVQGWIVLPQAA